MNKRQVKTWKPEEIILLQKHHQHLTCKEFERMLGRSKKSVHNKMRELKLVKNSQGNFHAVQQAQINYSTIRQITGILARTEVRFDFCMNLLKPQSALA